MLAFAIDLFFFTILRTLPACMYCFCLIRISIKVSVAILESISKSIDVSLLMGFALLGLFVCLAFLGVALLLTALEILVFIFLALGLFF